jgi:glycosyltransferase involved in cell wall biosynthesis
LIVLQESLKKIPYFKDHLKHGIKNFDILPSNIKWRLTGRSNQASQNVIYVSEPPGWVIHRIGLYLSAGMSHEDMKFLIRMSPKFFINSIVHFGSIHTFNSSFLHVDPSNKVIVTVFHGDFGIEPGMDKALECFINSGEKIDKVIVANSIMKKRMLLWGVEARKISVIPIGIDTAPFNPDKPARETLRGQMGIDHDTICIGSFQKDGNGFGEGSEPKYIKGPDLFVKVVEQLAKKNKVHCILTGPARGYVKKKLDDCGVQYTHRILNDYSDIAEIYQCLDLYLVTSREEGGPKALMESMAAGVPIISSKMGMAPDIICHKRNGLLAAVEDVSSMAQLSEDVIHNVQLRKQLVGEGLKTAQQYDWKVISLTYNALYKELLSEL